MRTVSTSERGCGDLRYSELREAEVPPAANTKHWVEKSRTKAQKCFIPTEVPQGTRLKIESCLGGNVLVIK